MIPVRHLRLVVLSAALLAGGCATTRVVEVNALADKGATKSVTQTYRLDPADPKESPDSLRFREVSSTVRSLLANRGFQQVTSGDAAITITVDYGTGQPLSRTRTTSAPVYADIGGSVTTTHTEKTDSGGKTSVTTTTTSNPSYYQRVGTDVSVDTVVTYPQHLTLTAHAGTASGPELWSATASMQDLTDDFRAALPTLASALAPYVGTDTGHAKRVTLRADKQTGQWEIIK